MFTYPLAHMSRRVLPHTYSNGDTFVAPTNQVVTAGNSVKITTDGFIFDSTNSEYITMPDSYDYAFGAGDYTIHLYFKRNGDADNDYMFGQSNSLLHDATLQVYILNLNRPRFVLRSTEGSLLVLTSGITLTDATWYHLAFVRSSGVFALYINGVRHVTLDNPVSLQDSPSSFSLGRSGDYNANYCNCEIQNFEIVKGVALWTTTTFTPPDRNSGPLGGTNTVLYLNTNSIKY